MTQRLQTTDDTLTIKRTYDAPPKRVYDAFVTKGLLERWYAPGDMKAEVRQLDAKVGGRFEIVMNEKDGNTHVCHGTFKELVPGKRIVHTFGWEDFPVQTSESNVTIELHDKGGKTEVVFTHDRLVSKESVEMHAQGWIGCLDNLAKVL